MTKDEALKMAIEAMKKHKDGWWLFKDEIQACKEALEQEEPFISFSQKEWMNQIALAYQAGKDSK